VIASIGLKAFLRDFKPQLFNRHKDTGVMLGRGEQLSVRWALFGLVVFLLGSGLTTLQVGSVSAQTPGPTVFISPSSGSIGSRVRVNGFGFAASQTGIKVLFGSEQVAFWSADPEGSFSASFSVPTVPAGVYRVKVGNAAAWGFTVTSTFSLSPHSGPPGTNVKVSGMGFGADEQVNLTITGIPLHSVSVNERGLISTSFTVPLVPAGPQLVSISGSSSGGEQATFTVTPGLIIDLLNGSPGAVAVVNGVGFAVNEPGITVRFDRTTVASEISADNQGKWSSSFIIPASAAGSHTIRALGSLTSESDVPKVKLTVVSGIISLDPSFGSPGTAMKVNGTGAGAKERITVIVGDNLARTEATANSLGEWTAEVTVPPSPQGALAIRASGSTGQGPEASFTVTPTIILTSEPTGPPGSSLTIKGEGFGANQIGIPITFADGVVTSVSSNAQGSWTATFNILPAPRGTYPIKVSGSTRELQILVTVTPGMSLRRNQGRPGDSVTVIGFGFVANERDITVIMDQTTVASGFSATADGSWSTSFTIPALPSGAYTVWASGSQTSASNALEDIFALGSYLTLSSATGTPGATISIAGRGFGARERDLTITFDSISIATGVTADAQGTFTISFVVPPSASGSHSIKVSGSTSGAVAGSESSFQVVPRMVLDTSTGPPGTSTTVKGTGFGAGEQNIIITYDGAPMLSQVSADAQGSFEVSFPVPPSAAGSHVIRVAGLPATWAARTQRTFTILPNLALSELYGHVGMNLEIAGQGFESSANMTLTYDDLTKAVVSADDSGSFRLDFFIPKSTHGRHLIKVSDDKGNKVQVPFIVEDVPPSTPDLLSPGNGEGGGFFGGFRPVPKWSSVDDPSGISYTLAIATDPDFLDPILVKEGLASPAYALTEDEGLPRGKYYWKVKAVDGASNEGPWSGAFLVRSGTIPRWALLTVAVLGVLTSGGGTYAIVHRRRKRAREEAILPEFVRLLKPQPRLAALKPPTGDALAPAPRRRALPSPFGRRQGLSLDERAQVQIVLEFVGSIALLEVSYDLAWLEELVETMGNTTDDVYELVLEGQVDLLYQPAWMQHPAYAELQGTVHARSFLQSLEAYVNAVTACAEDTRNLLGRINADLMALDPLGSLKENQWRFVLTVGQSTIAWFRGIYLEQPSTKDYAIIAASGPEGASLASLQGKENTPFSGSIIENLREEEILFYRDLHIHLRVTYRHDQEARLLAAKMVSTNAQREQLIRAIAQLGQLADGS